MLQESIKLCKVHMQPSACSLSLVADASTQLLHRMGTLASLRLFSSMAFEKSDPTSRLREHSPAQSKEPAQCAIVGTEGGGWQSLAEL